MSLAAKKQRQNAALKHGRRSPVLMSLGKKFGCTRPELHEGADGEFDPENCVYCQARWDNLLETRALLGNVSDNLLERAATTRTDLEDMADELRKEGKNPMRDKDYVRGLQMDIDLAKHLVKLKQGNAVNVIHHKAKVDEDEEIKIIDVTRYNE